MRRWFSSLDAALRQAFDQYKSEQGDFDGGTTIVVLAIIAGESGTIAYWAHAGDSRLYGFTQDEPHELSVLTHDHSKVMVLIDQGLYPADMLRSHPERNVVTRALRAGRTAAQKQFDHGGVIVEPFTYLLCSDGLWEMMYEEEIEDVLSLSVGPAEAAAALIKRANDYGGQDNVTVIVVDVDVSLT